MLFFGTAPANVSVPRRGKALCGQLLSSTLAAVPGQPFQLAIAVTIGEQQARTA